MALLLLAAALIARAAGIPPGVRASSLSGAVLFGQRGVLAADGPESSANRDGLAFHVSIVLQKYMLCQHK